MEIFSKLRLLLLFNTIEQNSNGITFYELKQYNHIPHSRIYREMNRLCEHGYLRREETQNELGRPKYLFFLSKKGLQEKERISADLQKILVFLKEKFPEDGNLDVESFLCNASLSMWQDPIQNILKSDKSYQKKKAILERMYEDVENRLTMISNALAQLETSHSSSSQNLTKNNKKRNE
ncbi:MAG: hypothetical protein K9W44_06945 [Candidatus Lokiarchaeota archaeon]|nr:hypothetical protein [Candidatus Harpocratesius repetitus]